LAEFSDGRIRAYWSILGKRNHNPDWAEATRENRHIRPIVSSEESKIHRLSFLKTFHFLLISLASTYGVTARNFDSVCEWGGLDCETQLAMHLRISIGLWGIDLVGDGPEGMWSAVE
jgi:hypothetical protein